MLFCIILIGNKLSSTLLEATCTDLTEDEWGGKITGEKVVIDFPDNWIAPVGCDHYNNHPQECGKHDSWHELMDIADEDKFVAGAVCCACGGIF